MHVLAEALLTLERKSVAVNHTPQSLVMMFGTIRRTHPSFDSPMFAILPIDLGQVVLEILHWGTFVWTPSANSSSYPSASCRASGARAGKAWF